MNDTPEIRWQSHVKDLNEVTIKLYETKEFSDVEFMIKGDHRFKAHKLVLSAQSSVFESMLLKNEYVPIAYTIEEESYNIKEDSITETGFEILLRFIYTNEMDTDDRKEIIEAYLAVLHFQVKALESECTRKICSWTITKDNVWGTLNAGLNVSMVRERCISFIRNNTNDALDSPAFLKASFKCLSTILEDEVLNSVPTLPRIHRIMQWASKRYLLTEKQDYSLVREDFLLADPPLLRKLEFEKLKLDDLAVIVETYQGLLTGIDVVHFIDYSRGKNASLLPDWCRKKKS